MRSGILYSLTLVLSYCSIVYELLLAQSMAATMGNTFLRYNLTIGFYLASLGLGAMICFRFARGEWVRRLIDVELIPHRSVINDLGIKGVGESGPIPGAPAIANAVEDALADRGVVLSEAPVRPALLFEALHARK